MVLSPDRDLILQLRDSEYGREFIQFKLLMFQLGVSFV